MWFPEIISGRGGAGNPIRGSFFSERYVINDITLACIISFMIRKGLRLYSW